LFAYGLGTIDGLHDRLGEIRETHAGTRGEVFARQTGSRQHYASDVAPMDFGFGFRQSTQMLQVGGSILSLTENTDSLRAGWALDRGTTTVTPSAPDGVSHTRYSAGGFSAWLTWQRHDGWYVDAVAGAQRYRGAVDTDLRGRDVARLRANGRLLSVETGYPFSLGAHWSLEPQIQVSWQTLTFQPLRDKDNVVAALTDAQQLTTRLGARLRRTTNGRLIPYARVDLVGSTGGRGHAVFDTPGDELTLAGGQAGRQLRMGAGLVANPLANLQLYGEGTWRTAIGSHGFRGWAGNLGVRLSF
jgi:outer membrane autotransporter protein